MVLNTVRCALVVVLFCSIVPLFAKKMLYQDSSYTGPDGNAVFNGVTTYEWDANQNCTRMVMETVAYKMEFIKEFEKKNCIKEKCLMNDKEQSLVTHTYRNDLLIEDRIFKNGNFSGYNRYTYTAQRKRDRDSAFSATNKLTGLVVREYSGNTTTTTVYDSTLARFSKSVAEFNAKDKIIKGIAYGTHDSIIISTSECTYNEMDSLKEMKVKTGLGETISTYTYTSKGALKEARVKSPNNELITTKEYDNEDLCYKTTTKVNSAGVISEGYTKHSYKDVQTSISLVPSVRRENVFAIKNSFVNKNSVTLSMDKSLSYAVELFDSRGALISKTNTTGTSTIKLPVENWITSGNYFVVCTAQQAKVTKHIVLLK